MKSLNIEFVRAGAPVLHAMRRGGNKGAHPGNIIASTDAATRRFATPARASEVFGEALTQRTFRGEL
jgi:hypothetical protein